MHHSNMIANVKVWQTDVKVDFSMLRSQGLKINENQTGMNG